MQKQLNANVQNGVGGWLVLLIITLIIIRPATAWWTIYTDFNFFEANYPALSRHVGWVKYKMSCWIIWVFSAACTIFGGYRLYKIHVRHSVVYAIISMWIAEPICIVLIGCTAIIAIGTNGPVLQELVIFFIKSIIFCSIWTAYLLRSKRAKNTYR